MLIPIIQTDSVDELQAKLDSYAAIDLDSKPTHFQIDINDGLFTQDFSVQPSDLRDINWYGFTHEYHLLVDNPDEYLGDVVETGATTVIAQIEHMHDRQNFIETAKQLKLKVGFALDLYTPISEISDTEIISLDLILLMSYKAGHSGPSFNPYVLEKIKTLHTRDNHKSITIDGGLNPNNIPQVLAAGATHVAVNSSLWHDGNVQENLNALMKAAAHDQNP